MQKRNKKSTYKCDENLEKKKQEMREDWNPFGRKYQKSKVIVFINFYMILFTNSLAFSMFSLLVLNSMSLFMMFFDVTSFYERYLSLF